MLFLDLAPPTLQKNEIFHDSSTLTVGRRNRGDPLSLYRTWGALHVLQKKHSRSGLAWSRPRADCGLSQPTSVFNNRCVQNFIRIG